MADQNSNQPVIDEKAIKDQIALLSFVNDLIKDRQDPNINEQNLSKVKELLLIEVNDAINRYLISLLSEKDQLELDVLLNKNASNDSVDDFFASKIPNLEAEIAGVLLKFRAAYLYPVRDRLQKQAQNSSLPVAESAKNPSGFPPPAPVPTDKAN